MLPHARTSNFLPEVVVETVAVEVIEQPAPGVITVTEVEATRQVSRAGQRDCAEMREGQGIMNVLRRLWGWGGPQKNEPQLLEQLGSDAG
jgi:hypothetical protein